MYTSACHVVAEVSTPPTQLDVRRPPPLVAQRSPMLPAAGLVGVGKADGVPRPIIVELDLHVRFAAHDVLVA